MTAHAATRTGGAGGRGLTGRKPGRQLRTVLSLAGTEALLLIRSVLVLAGLVAGGVVVWRFIGPEPLWWDAAWQLGYGQAILAAAVLVTVQMATGRARRDGLRELYDSFPVSAATRTLAHLVALTGALPASLLLIGGGTAVIESRGAIGTPSAAVLAGGVLLVIAAGAAGVALGARFPHPLAGALAALVLLALFLQSYHLPGALPWLFPWTTPDQLGSLPGPLTGYPPGGAHAVELAGIGILAAVAALAVGAGRRRHRMLLVAAALLAVAATCVSGAVQLRPIPTAALNRLVSDAADPSSVQLCTTSQVRYCLYPGFGTQLPAFQAPVSGVLAQLPARPAQVLTVAQAASLSLDDPPLTHGHTKQQLARWNAELQAAPANGAMAPAIYVIVGHWPAARFALALATAERAVNLPPGSPSNPGTACVALDQAREAIAIWLAITATHASTGELQPGQNLSGGPGISAVAVRNTLVTTWTYPGEDASYISSPGPQTTAAGYLLAQAMTGLPEGKVKSVLAAAWPTWLNWHTTDAQLAAALGIPMPSVPTLPGPPGADLGAQPQHPVCTS
jgi:hypothetical protein